MGSYKNITVAGKSKLEHRHVMEQMLGRALESYEEVHHKDEDKSNNDPRNLELMPTRQDHAREHAWNEEELLELLVRYNDLYGKWPSWNDAIRHPQMPHPSTFAKNFGSWAQAKQTAKRQLDLMNEEW